MRALGIDPGEEITGWGYVNTETGQITGGSGAAWYGLETLMAPDWLDPEVIIIEEYRLYPWMRCQQTWSTFKTVEVIGVAKYLAHKANVPVVMQMAAVGKVVRHLEAPKGLDKHALDALRHVFAYLLRENLITEELRGKCSFTRE